MPSVGLDGCSQSTSPGLAIGTRSKAKEGQTVNPIQPKHVHQPSRGPDEGFRPRPAPRYKREIFAPPPAAANREDHLHLGVLLFQLCEGAETAVRAVNGHLGVGPFIT